MSGPMAPTAMRPSTFAPLRVPEYRRLWTAFLVSNLGTFLQLTAAPWLMLELTGSAFMVALVTASMTLPRMLMTLPAGALADVFDRRTMTAIGEGIAATSVAIMAVLRFADLLTPELLLGLTFGLGVGTAISIPALQTLIPDLVGDDLLAPATALNSASFNVARAVGPAIGGLFVAAGRADVAFTVNALSFLAVIVVLFTLPQLSSADPTTAGVWQSTAAGLRFVRFTRAVLVVVAVTAVFNLTAPAFQTLLPSVVSDDLQLGANGYGLLLGVFGAGSLLGALTRERVRDRVRLILPLAILGNGVVGMLFGFVAREAWSAAALLFVAGLTWVWTVTTMNTIVQIVSPRWVRGRAMSVYLLSALGMQPIAAVLAGTLAELLGAANAVGAMAVVTVVLGIVTTRIDMPVLGEVRMPSTPDDWSVPRHLDRVPGSPVVVTTTWRIPSDDLHDFFAVMRDLRRQRLRTGARSWSLYRHAEDPLAFTEYFQVHDWDAHLAQHDHIDDEAAAVIRRAHAFDIDGAPRTGHVARVDLASAGALDDQAEAMEAHARNHHIGGSAPREQD